MDIDCLIDILHREGCSCVIYNHGQTRVFHQRGVKDLYALLTNEPETLSGAMIADKVVGKGAAALMIAGRVSHVYADVISTPALDLFKSVETDVNYGQRVDNIINRKGDGICPVETLCLNCRTADECIPLIKNFIINLK